jgi:tetratricopeptide (TPR) repeat protein
MSAPASARFIDAFDPNVTAFRTNSFSLREDLDWLDRLRTLRAPVGVILHGTRIVEVLTRQAVALAHLSPRGDGLADSLSVLVDDRLLPPKVHQLLDRLRDLGNKARHATRNVTFADAEHGYLILLRGLHWYFCEFPKGPGLKCLSAHNQPLDALLPSNLAALLTMLESADLNKQGFLNTLALERPDCPLLLSAVLPAVLIQRLLDGGRTGEAQAVLTAARARFPDDIRLRQLQGLLWSREGRLEEACAWLEAIEDTDSATDEETQGILAGAYKRQAEADPQRQTEWLKKCHASYAHGWQRSRQSNTYLGINAAATALWLGLPHTAIATTVRDLLEARRLQLARTAGEGQRFLGYWDQLTLAEAHLLLRCWEDAHRCYAEAKERFPKHAEALKVAQKQAKKDLDLLGESDRYRSIFPE